MPVEGFEYDEDAINALRNPPKDEDKKKDDDIDEEIDNQYDDHDGHDDEEENEYTPVQLQAMEQGWRPLEEWDGEEDDWVDAKEFVYRGQLMERISKQNKALTARDKELDQVKKAIKALADHNKKMQENEHKRLKALLRREKAEAMEENDTDRVLEIEDRLEELADAKAQLDATEDDFVDDSAGTEEHQYGEEDLQLMRDWTAKNSKWFNKDSAMTATANMYADQFLNKNPEDVQGMLEFLDRKIRQEFPHKFKSTRKGAAVTEGGRRQGKKPSKKSKYTPSDLSEEQLHVARSFERQGVMSLQEYTDQLALQGELPAQQGDN